MIVVVFNLWSTFCWHANTDFMYIKFLECDLSILFVTICLCWLQAIPYTWYVVVFTFYRQAKFCTSGSNGSLGIAFKPKVKKHLCTTANILRNIL